MSGPDVPVFGEEDFGDFRSGFATLVGRPNVGKSTLLNKLLGQKVTIVSERPQTTRTEVRGVLHRPEAQIVFVDTPGIHRPRSPLGGVLNETAAEAARGADVVVLVLDATGPVGPGDTHIAGTIPAGSIVAVNKIDLAKPDQVVAQLAKAAELTFADDSVARDSAEFVPISAETGEGLDVLVDLIVQRLPPGPQLYPDDMVTDVPEAFWVAELVREQLLAIVRDELPHSIATRVTEWEWPRVRCEILVERDSQKGIVIGKKGAVLKQVGIEARKQMPEGAFLELHVKVDADWQRRPRALERLGYGGHPV